MQLKWQNNVTANDRSRSDDNGVDDKSAKRIGEFREASYRKRSFRFELSKQRKSARSFVKKVRALLLVYKISYFTIFSNIL